MVMCLNCGVWCQTTSNEPCTECGFSKFESGDVKVDEKKITKVE